MVNQFGVIQNNRTATDFIQKQMALNEVYKVLNKDEEREMVEKYAKLVLVDGKPKYNDKFECEFEWIGSREELIENLVMHNLQLVTKISKKHCHDTCDYDNMFARGLFGLVRAANEFHPFKLITKTVGYETNEKGKKVAVKGVKYDENGDVSFIKFGTLAHWWIFKYIMDEFQRKSIMVDNNSTTLDELLRIINEKSKKLTLENFVSDMLAPEIEPKKTLVDEISASEASNLYESIHKYIETSNELSSAEKSVLESSFYGDCKDDELKKLSSILKMPQYQVVDLQMSALGKLKDYLYEEYGIESLEDVL